MDQEIPGHFNQNESTLRRKMNKNTYWENNGKYERLTKKLHKLIPYSGPVAHAEKNKNLEKYRLACIAYHDLFNNGLCNYAPLFRKIFKFAGTKLAKQRTSYYPILESKMGIIILMAAKEQGIK